MTFIIKGYGLDKLFINGDSGISDSSTVNMNRSNGTRINDFLFGMSVAASEQGQKSYYKQLKDYFSNKTHDYVGVSYYEKKTGLLRAIMVYDCAKKGSV